jgi:uncharacterized protein involved in exopolysaccharide biosynthesis
MTDADDIRAQIQELNRRAHEIVATLRIQKALLEELATDYGNVSPRLQNVEFMLAAAEKMIDEPLSTIHTSVHRADEWAQGI